MARRAFRPPYASTSLQTLGEILRDLAEDGYRLQFASLVVRHDFERGCPWQAAGRSACHAMAYTLHHLAAGSCDLALDGVLVGIVVREITAKGTVWGWCAELFEDLPEEMRSRPFAYVEHHFPTLDATTAWLGGAQILFDDTALRSLAVVPGAVCGG